MTHKTSPERVRGKLSAPGARPLRSLLREVLGQAHYERMRAAMQPTLDLPPWEELPRRTREAYRRRLDYLIPPLLATVEVLRTKARDEPPVDLTLREGVIS